MEPFIPTDTKLFLVHIAGYVSRNDKALDEKEFFGQAKFYFAKYGLFTKRLDRGGLKVPTDQACQWTFFCFMLFQAVKTEVRRKSLNNLVKDVSEFYNFNMKECHYDVLILLNKLCQKLTPRSRKEPALKMLKLSLVGCFT